jgi:hypothetical protein
MQIGIVPRPAHRRHSQLACLITSLIVAPLGSCSNGERDTDNDWWGPEDDFSPMTGEEEQVLERMRYFLDAAEKLDTDTRIPEAVRAELRQSVRETRDALAEFLAKRQQGGARTDTLKGIGVAAVGILGNDATGIGVADDVLLIGLGLIALGVTITTHAPTSSDDLANSWYYAGKKLDRLGTFVKAAGEAIADTAGNAIAPIKPNANQDLLDRLSREPANSNTAKPPGSSTVDVTPVPVPVPKPKTDPRDEDDVCKPRPWCPHKGGDVWHNLCADQMLGNVYPTCDAMVNAKRFDALAGRTLFELKTDAWGTYKDELKKWTLDAHVSTARTENNLATACGFEFAFVVADPELFQALSRELERRKSTVTVRYEPRCSRENMPANMR